MSARDLLDRQKMICKIVQIRRTNLDKIEKKLRAAQQLVCEAEAQWLSSRNQKLTLETRLNEKRTQFLTSNKLQAHEYIRDELYLKQLRELLGLRVKTMLEAESSLRKAQQDKAEIVQEYRLLKARIETLEQHSIALKGDYRRILRKKEERLLEELSSNTDRIWS
ncbi:hypothetical protein OLMES_5449 [Oleiphilus messinensis]|uniref:Uncharacterized protein n=1 Tax=Oleiphilus messinensis TaxID=141451 RepID=A0A1Y0IH16_9GAMM|nr:hypothetical protein [Oleiphilus messinensis]ARU59429.1 hypothetical protein OLMES_5449 [Oleiphilus messinensis]